MRKYYPLLAILALGTILRFYNNLNISLWHDEAFSALMIRYPWEEMFYRLGLDVHPPAYYVALRLWHYVFGDSLFSLRGFSIFFGVGTIWAGWLFVREAFKSQRAALWTALLIAINPFALRFALEARMYTFGAFFALSAGYLLIKALNSQKAYFESTAQNMPGLPETKRLGRLTGLCYLGFALCTGIIVQTHYYLFFTAAALIFYGLVYLVVHHQEGLKKFLPLLGSCFLIFISFLPWLESFLFQFRQVQAGYWISPMNVWSIPSTFWDMLLGFARDINNPSTQAWVAIITLFCLFVLAHFLKKTESPHKWLVVLAVVAPFAGALMFAFLAKLKGSSSSVYLDRYFLFSAVYFSIALAVWLKNIRIKWLSTSLAVIYVFINLLAFSNFWQALEIKSKPGMQAAAKFLHANVEPKQHVFLGTSFEFFNYKYYAQTGFDIPTRPLLYTGGRQKAESMSHVEGVAMLEDADLVPDLGKAVKRGETAWLIWTYAFGSKKPDLPLNWTMVDEQEFRDVKPYAGTSIFVSQYRAN